MRTFAHEMIFKELEEKWNILQISGGGATQDSQDREKIAMYL